MDSFLAALTVVTALGCGLNAGVLVYPLGTVGLTITYHVPRNNALAALQPQRRSSKNETGSVPVRPAHQPRPPGVLPPAPHQGGLVIDHVGLGVSDLAQSRAFYEQALAPLGYRLLIERDGSFGFGQDGKPDLFIHVNRPLSGPAHIAIASPDRATVDAFHTAGLAAGGRDNGPPGPRSHYHQHYYGAFILDPDGNNLEAVCHRPA